MMECLIEPKGLKRSSLNHFLYKLLSSNTIQIHSAVTDGTAGTLSTISLRIDFQTDLIRYL